MKKFYFLALALMMIATGVQARLVNLDEITATSYTLKDGDTIKGTLDGKYGQKTKLTIKAGATIVLHNAWILGYSDNQTPWAGLTCAGNATIILKGSNIVYGFYSYYPGIYVPEGKTLTIEGTGKLEAGLSDSKAAGIGGGWTGTDGYQNYHEGHCGNIVIAGGTITANGGQWSAGVGTGRNSRCGKITVKPETDKLVAAKGADAPYCIGAGESATCTSVKMNGKEYVDASESKYGVNASDGTYTYKGWTGDLSAITVSAKDVRNGSTITGTLSRKCQITIPDGYTVYLNNAYIYGENDAAYACGGLNCEGDATIILQGSSTVYGNYKIYPGIYVKKGKTLTIQGTGSLFAYSNGEGAGIGGGKGVNCGNIKIESAGMIYAEGGAGSAGIGGGDNSSCGKITIANGVSYLQAKCSASATYSVGAGTTNASCSGVTAGSKNYGSGITKNPYTFPEIEGIEEVIADAPQINGKKIIYNGQVLIIKGNKAFNLLGQEIQ